MSSIVNERRTNLRSEFDMACPKCGQAETLSIEIVCTAILSIDGTEPQGDHYWDETSSCICDACGHNGTVAHFRINSGAEVQS